MKTLEQALEYQNQDVVDRFRAQFKTSEEDALEAFNETKRWLWFAANARVDEVSVDRSILIIDEMWHAFISFTAAYTEYCLETFGSYLHHRPVTRAERDDARRRFADDPEGFVTRLLAAKEAQYRETVRLVGTETLRRWHLDYRERFSVQAMNSFALAAITDAIDLADSRERQPESAKEMKIKSLTAHDDTVYVV